MPEPVNVLVVAHQTAANRDLVTAVRHRAVQGPARFHLVVPRRPHGMHKVVDPLEAGEREAHRVLQDALPRLSKAAGSEVTGSVGDPEPLMAIEDAVNLGNYDEIIISTLPLGISRWLKLDLVSKTRALGLPVTHVTATERIAAGVS
ncbi:MAG TPA: hypothetical protein VE127_15145 [Solirubrobacteraceae bacterium]|jgi:hypothetical protein|nr:hypothetical protein [Solirubrobacteraceae bacterium]